MRQGGAGNLDWGWSNETELLNDFIITIELAGSCDYYYTPGDKGCRYTPNGDGWPPSPPEVEYSNFIAERLVVALWKDGEKKGDRIYLFNYDQPPNKAHAAAMGKFFEEMMEKDDKIREELDLKVSNLIEQYF